MTERPVRTPIPVTYFGAVLGLGGLGSGWRVADRVWGVTPLVGEAVSLAAFAVWVGCSVLYLRAFLRDPDAVASEWSDPDRFGFVALLPVATTIAALAVKPLVPTLALAMTVLGMTGQVAFAAFATGTLWRGDRAQESVTPILLMPTVGTAFVAAIAAAAFGWPELGELVLGAGLISWLVMESVVLQRLIVRALPPPQRATLGIHFTPPALGCVAYLALSEGPPDRFAQMLFGYALFQCLVMLRLVPWLRRQAFSHRAWAYTFGISAVPLAALRLVEQGLGGPVAVLAPALFAGANLAIGWIALRSAGLGLAALSHRVSETRP